MILPLWQQYMLCYMRSNFTMFHNFAFSPNAEWFYSMRSKFTICCIICNFTIRGIILPHEVQIYHILHNFAISPFAVWFYHMRSKFTIFCMILQFYHSQYDFTTWGPNLPYFAIFTISGIILPHEVHDKEGSPK